ncbi:MAG: PASTA domain-containing protein [Bacteroidales bacterium]|jgi:beta-lactam-binding protein with PASTA domain|nr:PASTA domain-containing protein [Bacteroidales bacterium]MDZ4059100.1 PASTA domain-containing protein [Bacteroidales bacterium]
MIKKSNWIIRNLIFAALAVFLILLCTILFLKFITRHNKELKVPDFSGMTVEAATSIAKRESLRLEITDSVFLPRMGRGEIFRQNPAAGSFVKKNRRVLLTINSIQPKKVNMPSVTGFSLRQAKAELSARQLTVGRLIYIEDMATNNVLSQKYKGVYIPAGTPVESESEIDLELGLSPANNMTSIPAVTGFSLTTAKDIIIDNSLNVGRLVFDESVKSYSDTITSFVIRQIPEPTLNLSHILGSRVDLVLSIDKSKIEAVKK